METIALQKQVPVVGAYDVVVCGGGPSGFMAAIAAARGGARVALIERHGFLGGMATAGLVAPISEFCYNGKLVVGGIPWEFIQRLKELNGAQVEEPLGNVSFLPSLYTLVAQRMVLEAGVQPYLHAFVSDCIVDAQKRITHVILQTKSGVQALAGAYFIDSTGDGDIAYMAGVPMQTFDAPLQPASLCFCLGGVDVRKLRKIHHSEQGVNYHIEHLQEKLRSLGRDIPNFGGPWMSYMLTKDSVLVNMTRMQANMTDEREQTAAECALREDAYKLVQALRKHVEEFYDAYILSFAAQTGTRETRHIRGAHVLSGEEYASAFHFEDAIGRGAHPIDIHSANDSEQTCRFLDEAAYIPYRSLIAADFPNLLVPSRCFSADREASASARVQGCVMGLGQAAGFAAAQCAKAELPVQRADIKKLRETLMQAGANI